MSYFDSYKKRLQAQGNNGNEAVENATIHLINKKFSSTFGYKIVKVDDVDTDVIYVNGKDTNDGELLFLPRYNPICGSVVKTDTETYLITSRLKHSLYPKAELKLCNSNFPLPGNETKTLIGNDPRTGRPVYDTVTSPPTLLPCIAESTIYLPYENQTIQLPKGKIQVTIPYTVNDAIAENEKFEMYGEQYKIVGIDRTQSIDGVGLMILHCERVV